MKDKDIISVKKRYQKSFHVPVVDPLTDDLSELVDAVEALHEP